MNDHVHRPFLTVDEVHSLHRIVELARYEAAQDERLGRTQQAGSLLLCIADVEGVLDRHRQIVRAMRESA